MTTARVTADGPSPDDITLSCDRVIYSDGDAISVTLIFKKGAPSDKRLPVFLATTKADDIEIIGLEQDSAHPGTYRAERPVPIKGGDRGQRFDQVLVANAGETICALYYPPEEMLKSWPKDAHAVGDVAIMAHPEFKGPEIKVDSRLSPKKRKLKPDANAPVVGTLVQNGVIGEIVADELIAMPRSGEELQNILARTGGKIVASSGKKRDRGEVETSYLIRVDPARGNPKHLGQIRDFAGEKGPMTVSRSEVLGVYALGMELALDGYRVAVNPVLLSMRAPISPEEANGMLGENVLNRASSGPTTRSPRFFDVPRLWSFLALWEIVGDPNEPRIPVAFLDSGFASNQDFRRPGNGQPFLECRIRAHPWSDEIQCGEGIAEGFGFELNDWHGNGAVSSASARVNNGFGSGGTGGQVVVPRLYAFDLNSYWQGAAGIRRAASDGASLISLSSGYLCSLATTLGPDSFDVCNPTGRTLLCAAVTAALVAADTIVCPVAIIEVLTGFGFVTGFSATKACLAAAGATVLTAGFCVAQFVSGDWRAPIQEAVEEALGLGVPIVASAGNDPRAMVEHVVGAGLLPEIIDKLVDLDNRHLEAWQVLPAMIPGVICVGEASNRRSNNFRNIGLFGPRIDIWAPTGSIYFRPPPGANDFSSNQQIDREFDGTSDAAPYISGLIADAMAINPALNPRTPGLTAEQRQNIPGNIRELLVETAFTPEALTELGFPDNGERGNLVNGFEFLLNVARNRPGNPIPDIVGLGYELSANVSERLEDNDTREDAMTLYGMNPHHEGTISFLPGDGDADDISDVDFFELEALSVNAPMFFRQVTLTYPQPDSFGELQLTGMGWNFFSREELETGEVADTYRAIFFEQPRLEQLIIEISGVGPDTDNVYKLGAKPPEPFTPFVPDRFDIEDVLVNNTPGNGVLVGGGTATGNWRPLVHCGLRLELTDLNIHALADLDWFTLTKLPPIPDGKCQSVLLVEIGYGMRLTVYTPGGEILLTTVKSPARIPESLIALPLRLKLEAASAGTAVNYRLNFCYDRPPDSECASTLPVAGDEPGPVTDLPGTGTITYPQFFPEAAFAVRGTKSIDALPGATELPPLERSRKRPRDEKGLLTAADRYSVKWNESGPFRLRAAVGRGQSLKVRLLDARGNVMQEKSVGLGARPDKRDDTGLKGRKQRNEVALRVPDLRPGTYFVEFSHARRGTQVELWAPRARK